MFHRKTEIEKYQEFLREWKVTREKGRLRYALDYIRNNMLNGSLGMLMADVAIYVYTGKSRPSFFSLYFWYFIFTLLFGFRVYHHRWKENEEKFLRLNFYNTESDE